MVYFFCILCFYPFMVIPSNAAKDMPTEIIKKITDDFSLTTFLNARTINQQFKEIIDDFWFPQFLLNIDPFILGSDAAICSQLRNFIEMLQRIDHKTIPDDFTFVKNMITNSKFLHVPYPMCFLDVPNKDDVEDITMMQAGSNSYIFVQKLEKSLLKKAGRWYNPYYNNSDSWNDEVLNEKIKFFFPLSASLRYSINTFDLVRGILWNISYLQSPWKYIREASGGCHINTFLKKKIRIPDVIIKPHEHIEYIFVYEDRTEKTNFISLYSSLRNQTKNNEIDTWFNCFLEWAKKQERYKNIKNIIDIHIELDFSDYSKMQAHEKFKTVTTTLYLQGTDNFFVRSVFEENYGEFTDQKEKLVDRLIKELDKTNIQKLDIEYIQNIIAYVIDQNYVSTRLSQSKRKNMVRQLVNCTRIKNIYEILLFQRLKPQIEQLWSAIRWGSYYLTDDYKTVRPLYDFEFDNEPFLFQAKFYFLWYFKQILLGIIGFTIANRKYRLQIIKKIEVFYVLQFFLFG